MKEKDYPAQSWKILKIISEYVEGMERIKDVTPAVSIFGSARFTEDNRYYQIAYDIAAKLAAKGFSIISGGGPGIMEAANKGTLSNENAASIGLNIKLPHEQFPNRYQNISLFFDNFSTRKNAFIEHSSAFVVMPGGFGTLDEFFEIITLIQTTKIKSVPVVLVDSAFWGGLVDWLVNSMLAKQAIKDKDLDLFKIVDTADEAVSYISACLKC